MAFSSRMTSPSLLPLMSASDGDGGGNELRQLPLGRQRIGARRRHRLAGQPLARQFFQKGGVYMGVERLAELCPFDLVLEGVEIDEVEAVAQRRAADGRADGNA